MSELRAVAAVLPLLIGIGVSAWPVAGAVPAGGGANVAPGYDPALTGYVRFLEGQKVKPVDYIMGLFATHDLVILCERAHPETTQYDLISELVSDPRFVEQVGHVFTEIGTVSLRPAVDSFLLAEGLSNDQVTAQLRQIALNMGFGGFWEKTNYYDFLRRLHDFNRTLAGDRRVHVYPSDLEFSWATMTPERHAQFQRELGRRDRIMAENVRAKFNEIRQGPARNKALVIMNYRHAFPHLRLERGGRVKTIENTGGYLMDAYPGKVANVLLNSIRTLPGTTDQRALISALQDGKWDAAFEVRGNPNLGFAFVGSPFGADSFDFFPFPTSQRYQDVFTGFVFYAPLKDHRLSFGLPGLVDPGCVDELLRRDRLLGGKASRQDLVERIRELETPHTYTYEDKTLFPRGDCAEKIRQWLSVKPE